VNAPNPSRQVALVGEARGSCDFSQAMATVAHQLKRALQAQMHDVAVRGDADRSGKYPREVKRAAIGDLGQRTSLDALIQMGNDVVPETAQHLLLQPAKRQAFADLT
jgi:hypothetical protein